MNTSGEPMTSEESFQPCSLLYWTQLLVLVLGFAIGLAAAWLVTGIAFDFSGQIEEAKSHGIVSQTILAGYQKKRDLVTYAAVLCLPALASIGCWLLWAGNRKRQLLRELVPLSADFPVELNGSRRFWLLLVCAWFAWVPFDLSSFYQPAVNSWGLLGEEGQNLAWVQSILNGGVYARDFFCLYGPMLVYPLVWLMKLFGETILVERVYTYLLNLAAYGIVIAFLYRTIRSRTVFVLGSLIFFTVYSFCPFLSPSATYLRVCLALVPLLLACHYLERPSPYLLLASGAVLGQSLLFSQEFGLCAGLAVAGTFILHGLLSRDGLGIAKRGGLILAGCLASIAPMLAYFAAKGALGAFFQTMYVYPKLVTLGFGALPFPPFRGFLANPLADGFLLPYSVILVYGAVSVWLVVLFGLGIRNNRMYLFTALLFMGMLSFRSSLGRSDFYHVANPGIPAFLLVFLLIDQALIAVVRDRRPEVRAFSAVAGTVLATAVIMQFTSHPLLQTNLKRGFDELSHPARKLNMTPTGSQLVSLKRAGVYFDTETVPTLKRLHSFLEANTRPSDYVYFFPNEAAYYFLFNRNNPTRYAIAYFAITRDQRHEIVRDLERRKPAYLVYSLDTWRIDNIGEDIQVPEVVKYLQTRYRVVENWGTMAIGKRIE